MVGHPAFPQAAPRKSPGGLRFGAAGHVQRMEPSRLEEHLLHLALRRDPKNGIKGV